MRITSKIRLRKSVQILFFLLFLLTVLQANYPYAPWIPPQLFLWLDPLTGISTILATRTFIPWFLPGILVLLSPLLVGRAFCGWVCPLGTLIDSTDLLIRRKKERSWRGLRFLKTFLLLFFLLSAVMGSQLAWFLDPLPLLWRVFGAVVFPMIALFFNLLVSLFLNLGVKSGWVFQIYDWINLHFLPLKPVYIQGAISFALLFLTILLLTILSRRFWCRYLCPLGALLGLIAKLSPLQRRVSDETCTLCGECEIDCKMNAIEADFISTEKSECILCLNCAQSCVADAIKFPFGSIRQGITPVDLSRRQTLLSLSSAIVTTSLLRLHYNPQSRPDRVIRPPGAVVEDQFLDRCIRCNECVRICSTTGACLQPLQLQTGWEGLWTPAANFTYGYCEYNCNLCGQICPSGAIQPLTLKRKQKTPIGLAYIDQNRCIPYRLQENCLVCEEHCPTSPKAIYFIKKTLPSSIPGIENNLLLPVVDQYRCIGCGICEYKCPLSGQKAIILSRENEKRL